MITKQMKHVNSPPPKLSDLQIRKDRKSTYEIMPASYVFSYNSNIKKKALSNAVDKWFKNNNKPSTHSGICALLPRVILAGKTIGLLDDGYFLINPGKENIIEWQKKYSTPPKNILGFWDTEFRFGLLVVHLMHTISNRLDLYHGTRKIQYSIDHYLSKTNYFKTEMRGKFAHYLCYE